MKIPPAPIILTDHQDEGLTSTTRSTGWEVEFWGLRPVAVPDAGTGNAPARATSFLQDVFHVGRCLVEVGDLDVDVPNVTARKTDFEDHKITDVLEHLQLRTFTIGGNDIGFKDFGHACVFGSCTGGVILFGDRVKKHFKYHISILLLNICTII